ncbi:MAG: hypothetical protein Sapg2KO_48020 [Saprospiraceae bacterium]
MQKTWILLVCLLFVLSTTTNISAQSIRLESDANKVEKYMKTITAKELKDHLYILASDDYEGRETGTLGQKKAADYIARHFMKKGLSGPVKDNPNPYLQPINFYGRYVSNVMVSSPNATWSLGRDFVTRSISDLEVENAGLVFIGYGLEKDGYNDLAGLDLKGKGVVMISGDAKGKDGEDLFEDLPSFRETYRALLDKGVKYLITMSPTEEEAQSRISLYGTGVTKPRLSLDQGNTRRASAPSIIASPSAVARLFGESPASFQKFLDKSIKKGKSMGGKYTTTASVKYDYRDGAIPSENVLGFMEGTDLKDEVLVITSHYDHVGVSYNGEINNGADDDGSGTVSVLEMADAFAMAAEEGNRPRRSILFMTVTGEEKGLLGSRYYSDNPIFALDKTVANLNIDMIGRVDPDRADDPDYVYIIGSTMLSSDLHNISEAVAGKFVKDLELDYKYNSKDDPNRFYYRSDHYNFAKHNIPIIFYFNGTHEDYHRPSDTPDKIEYEIMEKRAQLVFVTAWELANRSKAPVVDQVDNDD